MNKDLRILSAGAGVSQIRGTTVSGSTGAGIPKHVTDIGTAMSNASTGSTSTVTVTFRRDPTDKAFAGVKVWAKGYQGNQTPTLIASGTDSPITCILSNTGESLSITTQATGNGGDAPISTAPTTGLTLPKSAAGGTGTSTSTSAITLKTNGTANSTQLVLNLAAGSNVSLAESAGSVTITVTIPNLDASKITTGQIALARGGTAADLSATGGTSQVLKQASAGAAITVGQLAASDLSNGTTGSNQLVLKTSPTLAGPTSDTVTLTAAAPTVAAAQVGLGATTATSATTGANGAVPAQVVGYLIINVAGTAMKVPYFNV